ncbi:hypothetical protein PH547_26005 [Rhizobium sp. CNPSo 3464]|uniref:hypothetical protein n=1 Tax=Rhizobium sp. CNPSo 3464 TaxID=3021406 RepID=UPI00254A6E3E|nr:hypothetical protein [Rhizobium sp. CNPSo 3464]MDK4742348.1 hypothetical protein [Rhizobium sp. CNPSo 3464]
MKPIRNARWSNPGRILNGLSALKCFLGKQQRVYLCAACLFCNLMFCIIGASPRQFIIFNILVLLASGAKTLEAAPLAAETCSIATDNRSRPARDWRPVLSFSAQLIVACYAATVLVDNLAASPTVLSTIH